VLRTHRVQADTTVVGAKTLRGRSQQATDAVLRTTGELADLAERAMADAALVARNARRSLDRAGSALRASWSAWSVTWTPPSGAPPGSWARPAPGWPASPPTGQ